MARLRRSITAIATPQRPARRGKKLLAVSVLSAVGAYFLDPERGARRRSVVRDRGLALARRGGRQAAGQASYAGGQAAGAAHELREKVTPDSVAAKPLNDQTLMRKVESEIFRDPDVPKGDILIEAVDGIIRLRGQASSQEMIDALVNKAAAVPEVKRVENLLHVPERPAPTRTDTPAEQRRDEWLPGQSEASSATAGVSAEERVAEAEPPPDERAAGDEGRGPAPLGPEDPS